MSSLPTRVDSLEQAMAELARAQVRTQQNLDQLSREMREFKDDRLAAESRLDRRWGELANKMGTLAEDIVAPGIPAIFQRAFGHTEEPNTTIRSWRSHRSDPSRRREFDVLAFARDVLLLTETKSQLRPEDLPAFEQTLKEARDYIPDAERRRVVGALATFYVDPSLVRAGERQGFLMLGLSRGLMEILNSPDFRPREF